MMKPRASCCLQTLMWPNCVPKASLKELQMRCFRWHFVTLAMHCLLTAQLSSPTCRQELLLDDSSSSKLNPQRMWRTHPVRIQFGNYRTSGQKDKQRVALRGRIHSTSRSSQPLHLQETGYLLWDLKVASAHIVNLSLSCCSADLPKSSRKKSRGEMKKPPPLIASYGGMVWSAKWTNSRSRTVQ